MKISYLVPKQQYLTKMSRVRFHQIKAISKLSDLTWSGVGWENYDEKRSVRENLLSLYHGQFPDLVIVFDHRELHGLADCGTTKCTMMNEMHCPDGEREKAFELMVSNKYDFIVCHHQNEMLNPYFESLRSRMFHIPHSAEKTIFKDYGYKKTIDVLLCGSLVLDKYQMRKMFVEVIERLQSLGIKAEVHKHPGGFYSDAHTDRYLVDFAKKINRSKICLTCSSIHKCAFGKYSEIPMCRSLLAGDVPGERQSLFESFMVVIRENDTAGDVVKKLVSCLEDKERMATLTEIGYLVNHAHYTMEKYADRFMKIAQEFVTPKKGKLWM